MHVITSFQFGRTFYHVMTAMGQPEKTFSNEFDAHLRLDLLITLDMEI